MTGSGELVPVADDGGERRPALPPGVIESARRFADASRAASTRAKYTAVWDTFSAWCLAHGTPPSVPTGPVTGEVHV